MVNVPIEVRELNPGIDWGDADRVQVLYAPMRSRDLNPESHDAKVRKLCTHPSPLTVTPSYSDYGVTWLQ